MLLKHFYYKRNNIYDTAITNLNNDTANKITAYTKTETNNLLNGKVHDSQVLTNVPSNALFTDTVYTHPLTHSISEISGLQTALNNKVDDTQVLTNVPANALFTDKAVNIWHSGSSQYINSDKVHFDNSSMSYDVTAGTWYITSEPLISQVSGLQAALDAKVAVQYGTTLNPTSYVTLSGYWGENSSDSTSWSPDLNLNVGVIYNNTAGSTTAATESIIYNFPSGYVGGTAYLNFLPWSNGGYVDIYVCKSSNNTDEVFTTRLATYNPVTGSHDGNHYGVRVDAIASGYTNYDQIKIRCRFGRIHIMGLVFTKEVDRHVASLAWCHASNVYGEHHTIKIISYDGTMSPSYGYRQLYLKAVYPGSGANDGWWLGTQNQVFTTGDGDFYFAVVKGGVSSVPAFIQDAIGYTQMIFTGQHRVKFENYTNDPIGIIVKSKGVYYNLDKGISPTINDSLPEVELCNTTNCKSVFGVISDVEDDGNRKLNNGNFVSVYNKEDDINRIFINSVGEGSIWVCNINGNLENCDYITTSTLIGYGQKHNDDILHNYTVAKITQDIYFNNPQSWVETRIINNIICVFVGCTYHCG